jgi:hypothetical protein
MAIKSTLASASGVAMANGNKKGKILFFIINPQKRVLMQGLKPLQFDYPNLGSGYG